MPFDPLSYLQKHGFTEGSGLGKHQQGRSRAIIPGKKQDLQGVGHVEDWSNQTSRFADVYARSVQNIGISITSSSSSESEKDEGTVQAEKSRKSHKRKRKSEDDSSKKSKKKDKHRKSKRKEDEPTTVVTLPPATNYALGFGMSAVKFVDAAKQTLQKANQYLGFTRAATLLSNNGEQAGAQQITTAATVQPAANNATANNHSFKELTKAWSTVDSTVGKGFLTPLTNDVFEGDRAHLYWNRVGSKLRRLHEQDQQFVATGTLSSSTSSNSLPVKTQTAAVLTVAPTSQSQSLPSIVAEVQKTDVGDRVRPSKSKKHKREKDKHRKHKSSKKSKRSKTADDSG